MFSFRDNFKRRSLQFMPCVNQIVISSSGITISGKDSVYSGKLLPAFFYCCKTTKINQQADQKQNTRTANSVTGSLSTCRDRGFPYLLRAPRQLFGWKNARVLRREIFCPFPAAVTVVLVVQCWSSRELPESLHRLLLQ